MRTILAFAAVALIVAVSAGPAQSPGVVSDGGDELPEVANGDWLSRVQAGIRDHEYRFELGPASYRPQRGQVYQAPNRALDLRVYLDDEGVEILERSTEGAPTVMRLSLVAWGREDRINEPPPGALREQDGCVERLRGSFTESYNNSVGGLEFGWEIDAPPAGDGPLVLVFDLEHATARSRGGGLEIVSDGGRRLLLQAVQAVDRDGRRLPTDLVVADRGVLKLRIRDVDALGPLRLKTIVTGTVDARLESDQASAWMGSSVATAGDVNSDGFADVIVGAPYYDNGHGNEGSAFVFLGSAAGVVGSGPEDAYAVLESNQAGAHMGESVSTAGDVNGDGFSDVIVGAPQFDNGHAEKASAFVFLGSATGIVGSEPTTAHARLESNQTNALMGICVATAGDVNGDGYADVIVGAWRRDNNAGSAFVFLGSAVGIVGSDPTTAHAVLEPDQAGSQMGNGVATAGDINGDGFSDVIVGAPGYDSDSGAAFVFHGSAAGIVASGTADADAQVVGQENSDSVGFSVSTAGDVNGDGFSDVIVGARYFLVGGVSNRGAALVFLGSSTGLVGTDPSTAHALLVSDQGLSDMGFSVSTAGDVNGDGYADILVGAPEYNSPNGSGGAAFLYLGSEVGIVGSGPADADVVLELAAGLGYQTGYSVATAGDINGDGFSDVIVGDPSYNNGPFRGGAALVYLGSAAGTVGTNPANAHGQLESDQDGSEMAWSVSTAGDVNGDAFADVIVGAPGFDNGEVDEGAAFVFLGSASGIVGSSPADAHAQLESNREDAGMGSSVATAGDVNGDGFADVVIGAFGYMNDEPGEGAAFVFLGSGAGIVGVDPTTAQARLESNQTDAGMGSSVATAGDVNGDGFVDVLVGASGYSDDEPGEGAAFVFLGATNGIVGADPATAHAMLESNQDGAAMGSAVSTAGDVNGDGFADVVVGASGFENGEAGEGAAFVFLGSGAGIVGTDPATAHAQLESNQADAAMGSSVSTAGDINGDSLADVIVGAPGFDSGLTDEGAAFVFLGSNLGIVGADPATAHAQLESNQADAAMGMSVSTAGDVNGDGFADVVVGASGYDHGETDEGAAFVFLGSAGGVVGSSPDSAQARLESDQADAAMGLSVSTAGDVNGDGFADVLVGAAGWHETEPDEGAAFVYLGNAHGRPVLAWQDDGVSSTDAVQPWAVAALNGGFGVHMTVSSPRGREMAKMEVEACPSGSPWGTALCQKWRSSEWIDTSDSTGGVALRVTTSSLYPGLHRWRARALYLPFNADQPGVVVPPFPSHGPWRRLGAQALEADIRIPTGCDLAVTVDNGQAATVPGEAVSYSITASNPGYSGVTGAAVGALLPATLTGAAWSCVGSGGGVCTAGGSGDIVDSVDLPHGATVAYTLGAIVAPDATGSVATTVTIDPPPSMVETSPSDNVDTDIDLLTPEADLAISKDDGQTTVVPGRMISYSIVASNPGPSDIPGGTVTDSFPVELLGVSWTCVGAGGGLCTAGGVGDIADSVDLPAGGSVTYTATATLDPVASGTLVNSATVSVPAAVTERDPADNIAVDTDIITPPLFADGFESGTTSAWSVTLP